MLFEVIKSEGLAHLSYMLATGTQALVIDPRRDIDRYMQIAREHDLTITDIFETHIHADFVSGSCELTRQTGATIHGGEIKNQEQGDYGFELNRLSEGDVVQVGELSLRVLHTPGHSSEHVSLVLSGGGAGAKKEWAVFTGDTLFAGEVGRPDLEPGADHEDLARKLFDSLHNKLMKLEDGVEVYPAHGEGSPCGSSIGARDQSTIGYERVHNSRLQIEDEDEFVESLMKELEESPAPSYYKRLKRINREGPELIHDRAHLDVWPGDEFEQYVDDKAPVILDTRSYEAFAGAHIKGSLNIAMGGSFPVWAGSLIDADKKIALVASDSISTQDIQTHLLRLGLEAEGYLAGGITSWFKQGNSFETQNLMSVDKLKNVIEDERTLQLVDVRKPGEWKNGTIPGARTITLSELREKSELLDREKPVAVYCGSGFRASIAASILSMVGFQDVYTIAGSLLAWNARGYELDS